MNIAAINMLYWGSTGRIMLHISEEARLAGHQVLSFSPPKYQKNNPLPTKPPEGITYFGNYLENSFHRMMGKVFGWNGLFTVFATKSMIRKMKKQNISLIHLHNLHSWCICLPVLFRYAKKNGIAVVWTLHDCWSYTGHCPYYTLEKCDKWKTGCHHCPQLSVYPQSKLDSSRMMYRLKKKWFTGVENMVLVTPSEWLAGEVKQSFLKDYPVKVINNGIGLSVFCPTPSDLREKNGISEDQYLLLAVASDWDIRKGLDVLVELYRRLDRRNYRMMIVGTTEKTEKQLPEGIIAVRRTESIKELAEVYSAADLLVNPTREDNFPTVNIEALACGTPVLTFRTGGSPEIIDVTCGAVVDCDDIDAMEREIIRICTEKPFTGEACLRRASRYNCQEKFREYVALYEELDGKRNGK